MRYALPALLLLLIALSCNDDAKETSPTVTVSSSATPTPAPSKDKASACESYPIASLVVSGKPVTAQREAINWSDPTGGCGISAHPFDTIILPATGVSVPVGTMVSLAISRQPITTNSSAWTIDVTSLGSDYQSIDEHPEIVEVGKYTAMRQSSLVSLQVLPTTLQQLDLSRVPAGDTIIEVGASWPEGGIRWIFRLFLSANK